MYADDICVFGPSVCGLQSILDLHQAHAESHRTIFNCSKTVCMMFNPFSPAKTTFHAELCNPITCQAIELESYSNPLRIQQVLQTKLKKKFFFKFFRFRSFLSGGNVTSGGVFGYIYLALSPNLLGHYYGPRFFGNQAKICVFRALE